MSETPSPLRKRHSALLSLRGLITFLVASGFIGQIIRGLVLFLAPRGRVARETGWDVLGLSRFTWEDVHITFAILFVAAGLVHVCLNWRPLRHYVIGRASRNVRLELPIALALFVLLVLGAIYEVPPLSYILDLHDYFKRVFWG